MNKKCSKCGMTLPSAAYNVDATHSDGMTSVCKQCIAERKRLYYLLNKTALRQKNASYYAQNADVIKRNSRKYYAEHGKNKQAAKAWRMVNSDKLRQKRKDEAEYLTDTYVKRQLLNGVPGAKFNDMPDHLVKLKREQLRLHRLAKEMQQAIKEKEDGRI